MAFQWNLPDPRLDVDAIVDRQLHELDKFAQTLHELAEAISALEGHFERRFEGRLNSVHVESTRRHEEN